MCSSDLLIEVFATDTARNWVERLSAAGVPAAPILDLAETLAHPQLPWRNIVSRLPGGSGIDREISLIGSGFTAGADGPEVVSAPPAKGQHTDAVLRECGYSASEIATLRADGAF